MSRTRRLFTSSLVVIALSGLNKVMGFARIFVVSGRFGTSDEFDAFTAANQLPELFYVMVSGGALAAALIPVYVDYLKSEEPEKARQSGDLLSTVVTLMMLALGLICGTAAIFSPQVTNAFVPDFDPAKQALTADLMRIILLNTAIIGLSGAISGALHAHQHFLLPALSPTMFDIGYFLGFFLLVPTLGIYGLAWGTVIGSSLHLLVQLPALIKHRITILPRLATSIAGVEEVGRLMIPRLFTVGAIQASDLFLLRFSSGLPEGAVSGYFYAYTLMQLPETLFGTTIALVVFPTLAEYFNQNRLSDLKTTASNALRIIWLLTIPSAIGLILLGRPAIALVLERGAFDADSTTLVYRALVFLAFRVVAEATLEIVARLFYAQHNTLTPMYCYIIWFFVNVILMWWLVKPLGIGGIALASTLAFAVLSTMLWILNNRAFGEEGWVSPQLFPSTLRMIGASVCMTAVVLAIASLNLGSIPYLLLGGIVGGFTYIVSYLALGGYREVGELWSTIRK